MYIFPSSTPDIKIVDDLIKFLREMVSPENQKILVVKMVGLIHRLHFAANPLY